MSASIWQALWTNFSPLWIIAIGILASLATSVLTNREDLERALYRVIAIATLVIAFSRYTLLWQAHHAVAVNVLYSDFFSVFLSMLVVFSGLVVVLAAPTLYRNDPHLHRPPFYLLVLCGTLGMAMMLSSLDLLFVFLGLELASLSFYIGIGMRERSSAAHESCMKYFILGGLGSALLLYGIALYLAATGQTGLDALSGNSLSQGELRYLQLSFILMGAGLLFKLTLFPFYFWSLDVYQGAPALWVAWMSSALKAAAFGLLVVVLRRFAPWLGTLDLALLVIAALSTLLGALLALGQRSLKRLLAASSVSHAGFMLMTVVAAMHDNWRSEGLASLLFYLLAYTLATLGMFIIIGALATRGSQTPEDNDMTLSSLHGLYKRRPELAVYLTLFTLSLAGFPLTAGFIAKYSVILVTVGAHFYALSIIALIASLIGLGYYLRMIAGIYFESEGALTATIDNRARPYIHLIFLVTFLGVALLALGVFPNAYLRGLLLVQ